ncbi:10601_t:CDS:2, partial [Dentiscutata heterogama]
AQFRDDWHLMFNNARTFNEEASTVYNDAEKLQEVFDETFEELCPGGQIPQSGDEMDI